VNRNNLYVQLRKLSAERTQAVSEGNQKEVERLDDELEAIREELEAYELDEYDERHFRKGYN